MHLGMEHGFSDFETELEDFEVRKTKKFERMWDMKSGGAVTELIYHKGTVYITSADHHVYAVDGKTGKEIWRFKTDGIICDSLPLVHKNLIYFGSYDKNFYCLDLGGKHVWKFRTGGEIGSSPSAFKNMVYFGSRDGFVYCLNAKTGEVIWRYKTGDEIASASTVYEKKLFTGSYDGYLYCIDTETGELIWRFKTGDHVWNDSKFNVHEGIIYFASFDNYLYAVSVETGREVWRFRTGKYGNCISPIIYDNAIYHPTRDGILYALDMEGKEIWRFKVGEAPVGPPIAQDHVLYVTSDCNHVHALERKTGKEIWRFEAGGYTWWQALVGDVLYVGSWDCHLYALDKNTGKEIWRFATSIQYQPPLDPPYEIFEMLVKKTKEEEDEEEEKYEVNVSEGFKDTYKAESEYQVKVEYQQKMKY